MEREEMRPEPDQLVENALLEKALGGDLKAQIYWLNNRRPDKWADKPLDKAKGGDEGVNVIVDV